MLTKSLRPIGFDDYQKEEWDVYWARVSTIDASEAHREFFRQVVYDHFDHFNEHYPDFTIEDYEFTLKIYTVKEVDELVRFFMNVKMELWTEQFDEFQKSNHPYFIFQRMSKDLTPPFPPIFIDSSELIDKDWRVYGRPLHLIEGTHRFSYLIHMARKNIISWSSAHKFVLLVHK